MNESSVADDLGRLGEIYFDGVGNKAGLLVGKIDPDRMGRDRVIEAKLAPRDESVSFDKRPAPLGCSIQIKSVLMSTRQVTLTLSVAERLAQTLQPTFICIVRMNKLEAVEMRLIHLLDKNLEKILKRLRIEFAKGTSDLAAKTISFSVKDAKVVVKTPGELRVALEDAIGPDMDDYAARKTMQKKTLGYVDSKRFSVEGSVSTENVGDLVDGLLGLRPLSMTKFSVNEERFGIKLPDHSFAKLAPGATAMFSPAPNAECILIVGPPGTKKAVEIACKVTFPSISPIPVKYFKALVKSPYIEAMFTADKFDFKTADGWDADQEKLLRDWITYFRVVAALEMPDCPIAFRNPDGVELLGKVNLRGHQFFDDSRFLELVEAYDDIRTEAGSEDRPISLTAIYEAFTEVTKVRSFMKSGGGPTGLAFDTAEAPNMDEEEVALLYVSALHVGDEKYAYSMKCTVEAAKTSQGISWKQSSPLVWIGIDEINDLDAALSRYRDRMLRIANVRLCFSHVYEDQSTVSVQSSPISPRSDLLAE